MTRMVLTMERVQSQVVRVALHDFDPDEPDNNLLLWECTVAQELTKDAQKAALKATMSYLNSFVDLSEQGMY